MLLAFDAYLAWYYPFKESLPLRSSMEERRERAYDNCCRAIDMHEMFERVTIRNHKSFLVHGAIFKVSRDIMKVGDVWAYNLSPLELQNAETKRTASSSGSRRLQLSSTGQMRPAMRRTGPSNLVTTTGYSTTASL